MGARPGYSKVPSLNWMTLTSFEATSFLSVLISACIPAMATFSSPYNGGVSEGTIEGVRNRSEDLCVVSRGRKACNIVIGAMSCELRVSDHVNGWMLEIRPVAGAVDGRTMNEAR